MNDLWAWVSTAGNPGEVLALDEARVSVLDHGLTVADGVFETCKVVDGEAFALTRHIRRLTAGALQMQLTPPDPEVVREAVGIVLRACRSALAFGRLRITVTSGAGPLGSERGTTPASVIVVAQPAAPWPAHTSAVLVPWVRNERSPLAGVKSTSYAENVLALQFARGCGASEGVLENSTGQLCEGTASNIFGVRDGQLVTPALATGCLAGVTRELCLEWFGGQEVLVSAARFIDDVDEAFLTSSTRDVHPLLRLERRTWHEVGPATERLVQEFQVRARDMPDP